MNGIVARDNFQNAVAVMMAAWPGVDVIKEFKITQSSIRLEQPLLANQNQYSFQILDNQPGAGGAIFNTEIRLRQQDTFIPYEMGLFIAVPASSTDATFRLYSYPNQFIFTNALQMRALYNGQIRIQIQNYQYLYGWDLQRHWCSNQTQQTAGFGVGSPEDQNRFDDDGFYPMQPYILFSGSQNIQININLPAAPTAVDANSRYVMIFRGLLAQTSTPVN